MWLGAEVNTFSGDKMNKMFSDVALKLSDFKKGKKSFENLKVTGKSKELPSENSTLIFLAITEKTRRVLSKTPSSLKKEAHPLKKILNF